MKPTETAPQPSLPESEFSCLSEFGITRTKLRTLGITEEELLGIKGLDNLKALAKKKYHKICTQLHPDARVRYKKLADRDARGCFKKTTDRDVIGKSNPGRALRYASNAYHWVMELTEDDMSGFSRKRDKKRKRTRPVLGGTPCDYPLPWHFDTHIDCGYGYQQSFDHIMYQ